MDKWRSGIFMRFETGTYSCGAISVCLEILPILKNPVNPVYYSL